MLCDLNDQLCQQKEDNMFDYNIHNNYNAQVFDSKYEQVDINNQKTSLKINAMTSQIS